jgi:GxxExxY protein
MTLVHGDETYLVLGACFEVYKELGAGFLEAVYQKALTIEFGWRHAPFQSQTALHLTYKGHTLTQTYVPTFAHHPKVEYERIIY